MARNEKKRGGRPRLYGKRTNFTFRIHDEVKQRLAATAAKAGKSLSEQAEYAINVYLELENTRASLDQAKVEAQAQVSAARVTALRLAGLLILRETDGRPRRVVVDLESLLAEADGLLHGLRSGFVGDEAPPSDSKRTDKEERRLLDEIEELRRRVAALTAAEKKSG